MGNTLQQNEDYYIRASEGLIYNPSTGLIRWDKRTKNHKFNKGDLAGSKKTARGKEYMQLCFESKTLNYHRLVWYMYYGRFPVGVIDHIDGNGMNNRISNLRECSIQQNNRNRNNGNKMTGVTKRKSGKWQARIFDKKEINLGFFICPAVALVRRKLAEIEYYGNYRNTRNG